MYNNFQLNTYLRYIFSAGHVRQGPAAGRQVCQGQGAAELQVGHIVYPWYLY